MDFFTEFSDHMASHFPHLVQYMRFYQKDNDSPLNWHLFLDANIDKVEAVKMAKTFKGLAVYGVHVIPTMSHQVAAIVVRCTSRLLEPTYSTEEVAAIFGLTPNHIYRMARRGDIEFKTIHKRKRYTRDAIIAYAEKRKGIKNAKHIQQLTWPS